MVRTISIVVAATEDCWGIGWRQSIPWKLAKDLKHFRDLTTRTFSFNGCNSQNMRNAVIMGRKTWESLPPSYQPLPNRYNHILTRTTNYRIDHSVPHDVGISSSLADALEEIERQEDIGRVFIIGGQKVYEAALECTSCDRIYLTTVKATYQCDTFFPSNLKDRGFQLVSESDEMEENEIRFHFRELSRPIVTITKHSGLYTNEKPHEEYQYLNLIRNIVANGVEKQDRTGVGTKSIFGVQMRFNLRNDMFPLLTTKKVFWRGVAEELLWFISGNTNAKTLQDRKVRIWDGNGSSAYLKSIGLHHREEGDLGPIYGFQWRHFGAKYTDMHADYTGQGFDQLADVILKLKTDPNGRRIILSAWNPNDLNEMALPPCHLMCQFYVAKGQLSCQMYQRSADMGLGVPFNIASYALLTKMIAHVTYLTPGEFVHVIGDAHIYLNHLEPLKLQLERTPRPFPTLLIRPRNDLRTIDDFEFTDFELQNYEPYMAIKMAMAV
uniref:Bifunctional dihydrofolate reductase-thymidylate synthase n=1 Tax=Albugo laibachii Nc14 TaxID=890382 RepID=F0W9B4_9STRA|nr:bifunctional dihydrofolate reductasethymidylate synthase 2 putative [Albugo laibachii Nc14]CCA18373.1 bifunctional dihydrofolate reductasethymidylate synthase 2 putative [Albugo laibachii Nc14]|eukprot:CCA18373.1 bifunctional dihydrofolate reductasethymidylate synthase 2 putative [Albugo laibachii Nc14]